MLADENMLAFADERFTRLFVQITFHAIFLLPKSLLGLFEVIRYATLGEERLGFLHVILFGGVNKWNLKVLSVYVEAGFVGVRFVKT